MSTTTPQDTIRLLLAKAEDPASTDAEKELARGRAARLMTRHAIDEAMLATSGASSADEVVMRNFYCTGIFAKVERRISNTIARSFDCFPVLTENTYEKPHKFGVAVSGWKSDLDRILILDASVRLQCASALKAWVNEQSKTDAWKFMAGFDKYKAKRQFILSFDDGLSYTLAKAKREAMQEAANARAEASDETVSEAAKSVALAVRSRRDTVKDWHDSYYGGGLRTVRSRIAGGGASAAAAGQAAGRAVNIGSRGAVSGTAAIGR